MGARDGLEAALLASWDRETLAVYADHLLAHGDPRGELIILDLELATRSTPELVARRTSLLSGWLGQLVPSNPHTPWIGDSFKLGFVDNLVLDEDSDAELRIAQTLASPLAAYLKRVTIRGSVPHLTAMLHELSEREHVWLTELSIRSSGDGSVPDDLGERLIAATPALRRIELTGWQVFQTLPHPALTTLVLDGSHALPCIFEPHRSPPNVTTLDLAFEPDTNYYRAATRPPGKLVLPSLRRLDLSRNEPERALQQQPDYDDPDDAPDEPSPGTPTALTVLAQQPIRKQLTHLKMPSLRSRDELERLEQLVSHMPALEEVEIARAHYFKLPAKLATSAARFIRPAGWPWPAVAEIPHGDRLKVQVPGMRGDESVPIADAAAVMERRFEDLDVDARYAWTRFWALVDELGKLPWKTIKGDPNHTWTDERTFPAALMVQALDACDIGGSGGWREFREMLRSRSPFTPGAVLTVNRERDL